MPYTRRADRLVGKGNCAPAAPWRGSQRPAARPTLDGNNVIQFIVRVRKKIIVLGRHCRKRHEYESVRTLGGCFAPGRHVIITHSFFDTPDLQAQARVTKTSNQAKPSLVEIPRVVMALMLIITYIYLGVYKPWCRPKDDSKGLPWRGAVNSM